MKLKNMGFIVLVYKSNEAYYRLVEKSVKRAVTLDYLGINSDDTLLFSSTNMQLSYELASFLKRLTYETPAIHNIWLSFHPHGIYETLKPLTEKTPKNQIKITPRSNKLILPQEKLENGTIKAQLTISSHDTVTVSLRCSDYPIHTDLDGLATLTACLSLLQDRLHSYLTQATAPFPPNGVLVPSYHNWLVTMWHVNLDSKERFDGDSFNITWEQATGVIYRLYAHPLKREKRRVIRFEKQDYPDRPILDAFDQIIKARNKNI